MGKIILEDIEVYAYHGHFSEENKIGGRYLINLELNTDLKVASASDNLNDTFDYQMAFDIVIAEMKKKSSLIEHVASRIADKLLESSSLISDIKIKLSKLHPPLSANIKSVSVELKKSRNGRKT